MVFQEIRKMGIPSVAVVRSACVNGKIPVTVKGLEDADFSGCVINGLPCQWANSIRPNGPDPSSVMLGCLHHKKYMSIEDALACTSQA